MMRFLLLLAVAMLLTGCAVGRNELTGEVVLGFGAGRLVETAGQAVASLGSLLPPPFGQLGILGGALLMGHQTGRNRGWDEREKAATVQTPLPTKETA